MPKIDVYDINGKKVKELELNEAVFGIEPNEAVVHSVLVNFLANQRQGTQSTKTRSEVSGGGRKPWRQKGTGRARQGSIRAPQWIKGGIALGPKPRSYSYRINKKEKQLAIRSLLSAKVLDNELTVVDKLEVELGQVINPEDLKARLALDVNKEIKLVTLTHSETSTGAKNDIKKLCEIFNARAMIRLNKRSFEKVGFKTMENLAHTMMNKEYSFLNKSYDRACGLGHNDSEKKWILDIDKQMDSLELMRLSNFIQTCEPCHKRTILQTIPSKNGFHLICLPFLSLV
jgi:large subunit ribosomal protein L4